MSDNNKFTFFEPPRRDSSGPRLEIVEKIQEIFSSSNPVAQQQANDSEYNQPIENTSETHEETNNETKENIQQISEYPVQNSDAPEIDPVEPLALPKPKIVEKIEEIFEDLPAQDPLPKDLSMSDILQEVTAIPSNDEQYDEKATVESNVSKTQVTFHKPNCYPSAKGVMVTGGTIASCESTEIIPIPMEIVPLVAKIPVVLSQFQLSINVHSIITLPEPALEIKEITKSTKLTQCLLIQEPDVTLTAGDSGNLFLKGFIRKNISYSTKDCSNKEGVCGDIKHCTVDVPFNCITNVIFSTPPIAPISNSVSEFQYYRKQSLNDTTFAEKDKLLSGDFSEYNHVSTEYFNELPFCELVSSKIVEYDEFLDRKQLTCKGPYEEIEFSHIEEKLVLTLQIKLLQNQQVPFGSIANGTVTGSSYEGYSLTPDFTEPEDNLEKQEVITEVPQSEDVSELILEEELAGEAKEETKPDPSNLTILNAAVAEFLEEENSLIIEKVSEDTLEECPPAAEEE